MVKLRKGPACRGTLTDGSPCEARVERDGERCARCLDRLASSPDVGLRRQLAADADLAPSLFPVLATDADDRVRLAVASRADCPLVTLQRLEHDPDPEVRAAAAATMSNALSPWLLSGPDGGGRDRLFTEHDRADLSGPASPEALSSGSADPFGDTFQPVEPGMGGPAVSPAAAGPSGAWRRPPLRTEARRRAEGADAPPEAWTAVLDTLEGLTDRLAGLEAAVASASDRLSSLTDQIETLGSTGAAAGPPRRSTHHDLGAGHGARHGRAAEARTEAPEALNPAPAFPSELLVASWLAIAPVVASRKRLGSSLQAAHGGGLATPLAATHSLAGGDHPPLLGGMIPPVPALGAGPQPDDGGSASPLSSPAPSSWSSRGPTAVDLTTYDAASTVGTTPRADNEQAARAVAGQRLHSRRKGWRR